MSKRVLHPMAGMQTGFPSASMKTVRTRSQTLAHLFREGVRLLSAADVDNARNETGWILESALGVSRLSIHVEGQQVVKPVAWSRTMGLLNRRADREPLQYILGTQEFCGLEFEVGPEALIPRPETELLVQEVSHRCRLHRSPFIADIGTGSGCIAVALAKALSQARLLAVDLSKQALALARRNAVRHGVDDRVIYREGDLLEPLRGLGLEGQCAVVASNPPYIAESEMVGLPPEVGQYEPRCALCGGPDGLMFYRRLLHDALEFLMPDGWLVCEVGQGQVEQVRRMALDRNAYGSIHAVTDQSGIERVLCFEKKKASF